MKNRITSFLPSLTFSSLLLPFLTLFAASIASAQIPSSGLVGYWPFNGNANDESGNGNNGTVNGATLTTDRFGNANSAYSFNGGTTISIPHNQLLGIQQNQYFSVSLWAKKNPGVTLAHLIGKRPNGAQNYNWQIADWEGVQFTGTGAPYVFGALSTQAISSQNWDHIVGVYNNGTWSLYINSILVLTSQTPYFTADVNTPVTIGNSGNYNGFPGLIDDVSIYNLALTPSEIAQIYTSQTSTVASPPCPTLATNLQTGLVGYWPFCGNANDESGNGNNGTVNGATLTMDRFGNANSAYSFDGNDKIEVLQWNDLIGNQSFSLSFWAKPSSTYDAWIVSFGNSENGQGFECGNRNWGGGSVFGAQIWTYDYAPAYFTTLTPNVWSNIVVSYDGINLKCYKDGIFIGQHAVNYVQTNLAPGVLSFGKQINFEEYFIGILDDISIYNRALTPTEITQLYTDPSVTPPVACTPFLGEDQTVCAGTSVTLNASSAPSSVEACQALPTNLQSGLVGYWPFCGNANDASGNGNNGTVNVATLTTDRFGNANSAYSFDGLSGINCSMNAAPSGNQTRSLNLWIKTDNINQVNKMLAGYGNDSPLQMFSLIMYNPNALGKVAFWARDNDTPFLNSVEINEWTMFSVTYDGSAIFLYENGVLILSNDYSFIPLVTPLSSIFHIGDFNSNVGGFNGTIDDVSIYNRALSPSEIQQLYTLGQSTYLWSTGATTASISVTPTQTTTYTCTVTDANGNACTDSVTVFVPQITATNSTICAGQSTTLSVSGINSTATPSGCPTLPSNLQTGLVGYWPFCGNANDASGNGNNALLQSGVQFTSDRYGNLNSSLNLSGTECSGASGVIIPTMLLSSNDYTVSTWFEIADFNKTNQTIFSTTPHNILAFNYNHPQTPSPNKFGGYIGNGTNWLIGGWNNPNSFQINDYSNWHLASIVKTNLNFDYYVDGNLIRSQSINQSTGNSLFNFQLGTINFNGGVWCYENFYGKMDDCTIYNRALSSAEIQQLYYLGQTTYFWSNGATTQTINVSPTSTTTYTCTVTTNGVSCTNSFTVVVNNPTLNLGSDVTACGTSTTLTAPTGYDSYAWSNGGTTNTTTASANGTYTCTVTQGGCSASDAVDVTLIDATITASDSTICSGQTITLSVQQGGSENTACAVLPTNLQTGLVGYWPFCGNANDESGNGNHGSPGSGVSLTLDRFQNNNAAYSFNGNGNIAISTLPTSGSQDFTISGWVNTNNTTVRKGIACWGQDHPWQSVYFFITSSGFLKFDFAYNGGPQSSTFIADNQWHNVAVTCNNGLVQLYIDGQATSGALQMNPNISGPNKSLGANIDNSGSNNFIGALDDMGIWNYSLTANQIQQLYTFGQTTYFWSNGATTQTINVSPTSTTTYTCTVTTNGVSCTNSFTVVVNNPTLNLGGDVTDCGTSTTLTAPTGYDAYVWSNGGTTNSTTVNANGTYTCTVTQGGCSASDSVDVTLVNPTITASDSTICAGETITLSVSQGGTSSAACAALPTNLQNGLVGFWPFCGNANDASGNGNNGTVNGATLTTDRFGNANSAYSFDGNDWIESLIPQTLGYTVSGWVFLNTNSNYNGFVQHKNNCGRGGGYIFAIPNGGDLRLLRQNCGECGNTCGAEFSESNFSTIGVGEWKHLVATCDAIDIHRVYLDGQLVHTNTNSISIGQYGSQLFSIGKHHDSPDLYFLNGKADDFLLYNRALSASEIQQLYTLGQTTYLWSNGATTPTINVSPTSTTTYTCTVTTNGVSCTDAITVVVDTPTATITPASTTTFCQGGSVVLNANTGTGLSYQWFNNAVAIGGATAASYTATISGSYTVVVANASTCSSTSTATVVTVNALPTATITPATATTFCQGGSVVLNANTGAGLSYQWRLNGNPISGATSSSYTANASGSYTVVVTNTSSCSSTSTAAVVTVNTLPVATITPATTTTFCQGGSVVLNANAGAGLSYQWRLNGNPISGATSSSYTANASGSYTVVVTNASTCSSTSTATVVTVNALPTATITPATATTFCQGGSVVLSANTGTGLSYQWRLNGNPISGATSSSYTANASGSYTVVVTNTATCSSTSSATVVTVNALPTATITPATATTFCQGGSVVLNANTVTGFTYQWFNNAIAISGATSSSYTASASGSYTVVVTNASACSSTSTATVVTVNALPTATITPATATTFCQGGSVVLNANTGTGLTYQWKLNGTNITGATSSSYTANASGSYTVVVTNANACSSTSTATVVTVNALPTATITAATATTFCQGGSVVLNANTGTGLTYQWFNNATVLSGATSSSYTANASGSYTVVVTNTATCSATSTATVVTVNALPTATITPATTTTFCQGGSVVLNANTGAGLSYQWFNNATAISGATSASYTATTSGSYTVVVTNASTCSSTSTATVVTVNALPTATITAATATTFCQGGSVVLTANTGAGLSYQWRLNGNPISGATSSSYTANASGSYTVVVTNASTCSSTSTAVVVTVNALPTAAITAATATTFCQGGSVVLNANTGTGLSYQWFNNATAISGATSASYTVNVSGSYSVTVTNASTCSSTSTATVVTVNALPTAIITAATATTFCQGGSVVLNANTGAGLSYQWFNNASPISGATTSSYTANASGSYTVVVTNASSCSSTSTATVVTVNALPTATITAATATTFCQGGSVVLNANTGTGLSYQWFNNASTISGATSASYTATTSGSYTVVITNPSTCSATSTATVVTVNALPTATITAATATTFCQGVSVVLNANTGTGLTYQWFNNASAISGATSASYTANASGSYTVVVTNASSCSSTSTATVVTVNALPTATITPATTTTFCQGGSVVLNANTGAGLSYQWFNNATAIAGATNSSYTAIMSGSYTVVVTNASTCSSTSTAVVVTTIANVDYFADADGDGFGDVTTLISTCVQPQGYVTSSSDCNDNNAAIFPGAQEICNDIDDDCNQLIDDGLVFTTYYADVDGDSFGDINNPLDACMMPDGYVTNNTDCNDNNVNQNAASAEICNGEDDDCDGTIDNGLVFLDYYADLDSDGFGAGAATNSCVDLGAGYVTNNTDCNNANANINPNATEICNSIDDNCDGQIDEGIIFTTYYQDFDNDAFGTGDAVTSCTNPGAGWVTNNTDCDDTNGNTFPGATELCNTIDDNCDGQTDEGLLTVYFIDSDGDTYGNPSVSILACTQPIGYTPDDTDCNDTDANINPGAEDIAGNGIDENCDGQIDNSIFELNATINLYPNPTRSELNIQITNALVGNDMYIFDAVGKLVYKQQLLSTQTTISVSNFADGNYVVRVGEVVKRFEVIK